MLGRVDIGPVDEQPLYPTHKSTRPFRVEIVPEQLAESQFLEEFSTSSGVLVVASQQVMPISEQKPDTSKATFVLHNMCLKGNYQSPVISNDLQKQPIQLTIELPQTD